MCEHSKQSRLIFIIVHFCFVVDGAFRYKLICIVSIVQNSMQGMCETYRCLWDKKLDKVAAHVYETPNLYAIATIYGFYFD